MDDGAGLWVPRWNVRLLAAARYSPAQRDSESLDQQTDLLFKNNKSLKGNCRTITRVILICRFSVHENGNSSWFVINLIGVWTELLMEALLWN